ncbi:MAG: hypothetical protein M1820_008220 [Bogoriella megaspora]|nr:MAG: hypothetical protein M1820_008220 [Bogoriella megaspora]
MADPWRYTYPSPLEGYEGLEPLPNDRAADGKSFINPPTPTPSSAYKSFPSPINNGIRGGFDVHVYFLQTDEIQTKFARELWERVRREFPELRIYQVWDKPIGPHTAGMFEVNLFTPAVLLAVVVSSDVSSYLSVWFNGKIVQADVLVEQFGAFIPWLVVNRGPLSALLHPNTDDEERDHTQRATWLGEQWPLNLRLFGELRRLKAEGKR